jgi:hypothetical protein
MVNRTSSLSASQQMKYISAYSGAKTMGRREAIVERYVQQRVKELGGFTRKVTYQGRSGAADQWCFMPNGLLIQIECKAPGEKPSAVQNEERRLMNAFNFNSYVADSKDAVDAIFKLGGLCHGDIS